MASQTTTNDNKFDNDKQLKFKDLEEGMKIVEVNTALGSEDPTVNPGKITEIGAGEGTLREPGEGEAEMKYDHSIAREMFPKIGGATFSRLYKDKVNNSDDLHYFTLEDYKEVKA